MRRMCVVGLGCRRLGRFGDAIRRNRQHRSWDAPAIPGSVGDARFAHGCRTLPLGTLCDTMRGMYRLIMDEIGLGYRRSGRFDDTIRLAGLDAPALPWFVCLGGCKRFQLDFACKRMSAETHKGSNRRSGGCSSGKYDGFQRPAQGPTTVAFLRLRAIGGTSRAHAVAPLCATTLLDAVVVPHAWSRCRLLRFHKCC